MEVVEYGLDMGTLFLEGLLKIGIHVTGNRFYMIHPFQADMLDEVVHDLLFLSSRAPEDMPGLHVDDMGSIAVAVVKLKFVNTKEFCMFFRPDQLPVRCGVQFKQAFLIYCLYDVLAQTGKFSYLLVRVSPTGQEITDILMQLCRDTVSRGLEGNILHSGITASGAYVLVSCQ